MISFLFVHHYNFTSSAVYSTSLQFQQHQVQSTQFGVKHSSVSSLLVRKDYAVLYTEKICIKINYYYDGMENIQVKIVWNQL